MFANFWYSSKLFYFLYFYNWVYFTWTTFWLLSIIYFLFTRSLRLKFFYFFTFLCMCIFWGFMYNLDGIFLILLLTELMLLFVFYLIYTQVYKKLFLLKSVNSSKYIKHILIFSVLLNFYISVYFLRYAFSWENFYEAIFIVVSNDFFLLYYFFFIKYPVVTIFIATLLGLFSLFFILIYFYLRVILLVADKKKKNFNFLRKQLMIKQSNFKVFLRSFQFIKYE